MKKFYDKNKKPAIIKSNMIDKNGKIQFNINSLSDMEICDLFDLYLYIEPNLDINQEIDEFIFNDNDKTCYHNIKNISYDLNSLKKDKLDHFSIVMDDFALLILKCQLINGSDNIDLNNLINLTKNIRIKTISDINNISTVEQILRYNIKDDDIDILKTQFRNFL